jgi:hypothetical protein
MKRITDEHEAGRKYLVIEKRPDGKFQMGHYNLDGEEVLALLKWGLEAAAKRIVERVSEALGGPPVQSNTGRNEEREFFFHQPRRIKSVDELPALDDKPTPFERKL